MIDNTWVGSTWQGHLFVSQARLCVTIWNVLHRNFISLCIRNYTQVCRDDDNNRVILNLTKSPSAIVFLDGIFSAEVGHTRWRVSKLKVIWLRKGIRSLVLTWVRNEGATWGVISPGFARDFCRAIYLSLLQNGPFLWIIYQLRQNKMRAYGNEEKHHTGFCPVLSIGAKQPAKHFIHRMNAINFPSNLNSHYKLASWGILTNGQNNKLHLCIKNPEN